MLDHLSTIIFKNYGPNLKISIFKLLGCLWILRITTFHVLFTVPYLLDFFPKDTHLDVVLCLFIFFLYDCYCLVSQRFQEKMNRYSSHRNSERELTALEETSLEWTKQFNSTRALFENGNSDEKNRETATDSNAKVSKEIQTQLLLFRMKSESGLKSANKEDTTTIRFPSKEFERESKFKRISSEEKESDINEEMSMSPRKKVGEDTENEKSNDTFESLPPVEILTQLQTELRGYTNRGNIMREAKTVASILKRGVNDLDLIKSYALSLEEEKAKNVKVYENTKTNLEKAEQALINSIEKNQKFREELSATTKKLCRDTEDGRYIYGNAILSKRAASDSAINKSADIMLNENLFTNHMCRTKYHQEGIKNDVDNALQILCEAEKEMGQLQKTLIMAMNGLAETEAEGQTRGSPPVK